MMGFADVLLVCIDILFSPAACCGAKHQTEQPRFSSKLKTFRWCLLRGLKKIAP